jgi:hypothetical protein
MLPPILAASSKGIHMTFGLMDLVVCYIAVVVSLIAFGVLPT